MRKIIISNFKMNTVPSDMKAYSMQLATKTAGSKNKIIVCPPYTHFCIAKQFLDGSKIEIGAQNVSDVEAGKNTGEISASMLKDAGVTYCIIGHSERRSKFKESDRLINKKIKMALSQGLKVILCIGEDKVTREAKGACAFVKKQLDEIKPEKYSEIVFCGYGEPILKLEELKIVAQYIKEKYSHLKTRINTNGQGNLIYKRNIVPELKGLIDSVSISFNGENKKVYDELSRPKLENAYESMKDFIKECVKEGIETTATIVTGYKNYKVDLDSCKKQIEEMGAKFRERPWLDNGY